MNRRDFFQGAIASMIFAKTVKAQQSNIEECAKKEIYLTFDDGPTSITSEILDKLTEENKATFFFVGRSLSYQKGFDRARAVLDAGHHIGNHSYSHPEFSKISVEKAKEEIEKTAELISKAYSLANIKDPLLFRFPYGDPGYLKYQIPINNDDIEKNCEKKQYKIITSGNKDHKESIQEFLSNTGYKSCFWNIDTLDYTYYVEPEKNPVEKIIENAAKAKKGDIVLMHELGITKNKLIPFYLQNDYSSQKIDR